MAIVGGICLSKVFLEEDDSCKYTRDWVLVYFKVNDLRFLFPAIEF